MLITESATQLHPDILKAYGVLDGKSLAKDLAMSLSSLTGPDILDLVSLANKVKNKFAPETHACTIMNAKSGACSEDCKFCAQSGHHQSEIEVYSLVSTERMLADARNAYANGIRTFGLVTSGLGYTEANAEFGRILEGIRAIRAELPDLQVCASLGTLTKALVAELAQAGVTRYNLNLQVNPSRYQELIATTHAVNSRLETIRLLKAQGIQNCSGGILGVGETMEDRIDLAFTLQDLEVEVIPLNVLIPIAGTALENQVDLPVAEIVKTFALFRLIHPTKVIKFAAGRETRMKDFQGLLMLTGMNGLLTGGYLTTRGREISEDQAFIYELKYF